MGLREKLNQHRAFTTSAMAAVLVAAVSAIAYQLWPPEGPRGRTYYTVDDGQTWFVGKGDLLPPFDYEGKTAVQAHVFACDGRDRKPFVGYLSRYTPAGQKVMEDARAILKQLRAEGRKATMEETRQLAQQAFAPREWKGPGESGWRPLNTMAAPDRSLRCPEGAGSGLAPVE